MKPAALYLKIQPVMSQYLVDILSLTQLITENQTYSCLISKEIDIDTLGSPSNVTMLKSRQSKIRMKLVTHTVKTG